jgi:hypothetical protein
LKLQSYEEILLEVFKKYNKKPEGWKVLVGRNASGFWDILFIGSDEAWSIKLDTIFKANPIGLGVKLDEKFEAPKIKGPSYGFRPVPEPLIRNLAKEIQEFNFSIDEAAKKLMNELKFIPPKPINIIQQSPITAIGPHYIFQTSPFSQKQKELDKNLDEQLRKVLRRKYPCYGL